MTRATLYAAVEPALGLLAVLAQAYAACWLVWVIWCAGGLLGLR